MGGKLFFKKEKAKRNYSDFIYSILHFIHLMSTIPMIGKKKTFNLSGLGL